MKKALVSLWLVLMCSCPVCACTSFAVYFTEPIYGMNLDIPDTEITIKVEEVQGITVFSVFFLYDHMFFGRNLVMASEGQFRAVQEQYPPVQGKTLPRLGEATVHQFVQGPMLGHDLESALKWLESKKLVHTTIGQSHLLFADASGQAAIIEVGEKENEIILMDDGFLVMTNFQNSAFKNTPYDQILAMGSDRYQAAYQHILASRANFDLDAALAGLEKTVQAGYTKCSMVFVTAENNVYFALDGDFTRIWRLSLDDKTVYTFRGFAEHRIYPVPPEGLTDCYLLADSKHDCLD